MILGQDKYLDLMNTVKILYDNRFSSKIDDTDSDSDYELSEFSNRTDIFFTMFEEYTCKCNTYTCESLCCSSLDKKYLSIFTE
jgi:hypothetical protein